MAYTNIYFKRKSFKTLESNDSFLAAVDKTCTVRKLCAEKVRLLLLFGRFALFLDI